MEIRTTGQLNQCNVLIGYGTKIYHWIWYKVTIGGNYVKDTWGLPVGFIYIYNSTIISIKFLIKNRQKNSPKITHLKLYWIQW